MKEIKIKSNHPYSIYLSDHDTSCWKDLVLKYFSQKSFFVLVDKKVYSLYEEFLHSLFSGMKVKFLVLKGTEKQKSISEYEKTIQLLLDLGVHRGDVLVGVGGGVIGDFTGFIASTLFRGMDYFTIPTTILACVDSSVGGKVAIDFSNQKNVIGSFYPPKMILMDLMFWDTLPKRQVACGSAEAIKSALICRESLFLEMEQEKKMTMDFCEQCIQIKQQFVENDEYDSGIRKMLNLGHTIGHVIEEDKRYHFLHGEAISLGICYSLFISKGLGFTIDINRVKKVLKSFSLPTNTEDYPFAIESILTDKKATSDGYVDFIYLKEIGKCDSKKLTVNEIKELLKHGL